MPIILLCTYVITLLIVLFFYTSYAIISVSHCIHAISCDTASYNAFILMCRISLCSSSYLEQYNFGLFIFRFIHSFIYFYLEN